jgi:hypothetical protein
VYCCFKLACEVTDFEAYRTYLNVVGMGSKWLGVLRRTLRWSSNSQKFKKLFLEICFFERESQKKRETDGDGKQ